MKLLKVLMALALSTLATAMASSNPWYTFWPAYVDNSNSIEEAPVGQPKTNAEFAAILQADADPGTFQTTTTTQFSNGGTQYWSAQISDKLVTEKYFDMILLANIHKHSTDDPVIKHFDELVAEGVSESSKSHTEKRNVTESNGEVFWYMFWAANEDNAVTLSDADAPNDQPKTNLEFDKTLRKDGQNVWASANAYKGKQGSITFWTAQVSSDVVLSKYWSMRILQKITLIDTQVTTGEEEGPELELDLPVEPVKPTKPVKSVSRRAGTCPIQKMRPRLMARNATTEGEAYSQIIRHSAQRYQKFISMPEQGNNDIGNPNGAYVLDSAAGDGVRVYIIDTGLNPNADAWDNRKVQWIYPEPFGDNKPGDVDRYMDKIGHGSCMADLAVGFENGVAPRADITAVQLNCWYDQFHRDATFGQLLDATNQIYSDIIIKGLYGQAVILIPNNLAPGWRTEPGYTSFYNLYFQHLGELAVCLGASIVVLMPNSRVCTMPPCIYGDPNNDHFLPELMPIGAGNIGNGLAQASNPNGQSWMWHYGPSWDINGNKFSCAAPTGNGDTTRQVWGGDSASAAITAGMLAYWQSQIADPIAAQRKIKDLEYQRNPQGPHMMWNGQDWLP